MENHQYKFALRYMLTSEYDMLEVNFANVVNYSELANLARHGSIDAHAPTPMHRRNIGNGANVRNEQSKRPASYAHVATHETSQ